LKVLSGSPKALVDYLARLLPVSKKSNSEVTGRVVTAVGISRDNFEGSALALRMAVHRAVPGDTVIAGHFPSVGQIVAEGHCGKLFEDAGKIVEKGKKDGVAFKTFAGEPTAKPLQSFVEYLTEMKPDFVYIGYPPEAGVRQVAPHKFVSTNTDDQGSFDFTFVPPR